jgi:uncharacterized Zn finger protein
MAWWRSFTPKPPRPVKGGIKAQNQRGAFATSWWGQLWLEVLESYHLGARLQRGRAYARQGQVLDISIETGLVSAKVQGSRTRPYTVKIALEPLPQAAWDRIIAEWSQRFVSLAKLLAGELPMDIDEIFAAAHDSLFPLEFEELDTRCSCPDWSNPCKHIAAVFYLLAGEFDRDPFLILKLRGLTREELFARLGYQPNAVALPEPSSDDSAPSDPAAQTVDPATFWGETLAGAELGAEVCQPEMTAALPKKLGNFPFWRGAVPFLTALEPLYSQAAARGLEVFLGETTLPGDASPEPTPQPAGRRRQTATASKTTEKQKVGLTPKGAAKKPRRQK